MNKYFTILGALFKNKLRFADNASKSKKIGFLVLMGISYAVIITLFVMMIVGLNSQGMLYDPTVSFMVYFFVMFTTGIVVLIFGIVNLVVTLYLSKDTDFYSMLPVKSSTVFAAKLSYVYISEAMISAALLIPTLITFGIVAEMWVGFYVISLLMIAIVPAIPLVLAGIIAIPVMFIASKLRNRGIVSLIFYLLLFGALFGVYIYFIYMCTDITNFDENTFVNVIYALDALFKVLYPYTMLAMAACAIPAFGLELAASTAATLAIFVGISVALFGVLLLCSKFMYAQSAKANNQTDNSAAKKGKFKSSSAFKSLIKREFVGSMRTTQVAFQCYATMIIPIVFAVILGIVANNVLKLEDFEEIGNVAELTSELRMMFSVIGFSTLTMMVSTLGNASATTFSREGNALATLKTLPVSAKQVLKAKIAAWCSLGVPAAAIAVIIFNVFMFDWRFFLLSMFSIVPIAAAFITFGALWDLMSPKLKWVDPNQAVKHNGHATIGQFICMSGGIAAFIIGNFIDYEQTGANFMIIYWCIIYAVLIVFTVVDIILFRKAEQYYNRIEI